MEISFYHTAVFSGNGVHKAERFAGRGRYDTHVTDDALTAVGTGKQDEIAQFSLSQRDRLLNGCKINRHPGRHNPKVIKHISHKTRTIETFPRIDGAIFIRCTGKGAGKVYE